MNADLINLIAGGVGIILSLMVTFLKPLANWFYSIPEQWRGLSMLALNALSTIAILGLSCSTLFAFVPCTADAAKQLLVAFLFMVGTNQVTYLVSPVSPTKTALENK